MKLFALFAGLQYDGEVLLGVYSSRAVAEAAEAAYEEEGWDFYAVREVVLDAAARAQY